MTTTPSDDDLLTYWDIYDPEVEDWGEEDEEYYGPGWPEGLLILDDPIRDCE